MDTLTATLLGNLLSAPTGKDIIRATHGILNWRRNNQNKTGFLIPFHP